MTGNNSTSVAWQSRFDRIMQPDELPGAIDRIAAEGLFAGFENSRSPDGRIETLLSDAVDVAVVQYDHPFVRKLLQWCGELVSRAEADSRWQSVWATAYKNAMHGNVVAMGTLGKAWLDDAEIDGVRLVAACDELARNALEMSLWAEVEQSRYLTAVSLRLIAGDIPGARGMLNIRKRFKRVQKYYDWFVEFMSRLSGSRGDSATTAHFDSMFDLVRHPRWAAPLNDANGGNLIGAVPVLRLQLALLRWLHIERRHTFGHWRQILAQISI